MGLFFDSAADKARKASIAADRAQSALKASSSLLGDIEKRLYTISTHLSSNTPASTTANILNVMDRTQYHAEKTLTHIRHLDRHVRAIEEHLSRK